MRTGNRPRPLLLFYILVVYVFIQFGWWAYLLVRLNNEITVLEQRALVAHAMPQLAPLNSAELAQQDMLLKDKLHKQWLMIFGEGSVFLVLLLLGILRTRNSFKKEVAVSTQQKNFLLSVTHELKSPLASVRLQLETIQKRDLPKEKQSEMLLDAIEDTDRLNALVENILVAARLDNHSYAHHPEKINLSDEVKGLSEKASVGYARHHVVKTDIADNIFASCDRIGFHSMFINIMENAVKYSKAGSEIKISLVKRNDAAFLTVADQGSGIAQQEKENVFGRFYRIGNEETRTTKGTGLGLYIVHLLAEAHQWKINIHDNPGGGSIFEITIPNS
ncbi:MAG: HAMP domain-containing histidine kinase [Bacteroidota bacterium]|nr:HAMP domain-containing histidine kinase [Bacteroidota bacterium]